MFDPSISPRLFALPAGVNFAEEFVRGFLDRSTAMRPEEVARCTILANSNRTAHAIRDAFSQGVGLLPRIGIVTDIQDLLPAASHIRDQPVSSLRRRLEIAQLVKNLLEKQPILGPQAAVFDLADSLSSLLSELQIEAVSFDKIRGIDTGDHSEHWGRSLTFLEIVTRFLSNDSPDSDAFQRVLLDELLRHWEKSPPSAPIIVAGSTGSRGTTLDLMEAVVKLPNGAVVLPGFDWDLPKSAWQAMDKAAAEEHPQFRHHKVAGRLGVTTAEIATWAETETDTDRTALISLALRPAPVTDQWLSDGPKLTGVSNATKDITLIEAPSPRLEALALALKLRDAASDGKTACLITPDRNLSRQVTAALGRWGIQPDDSAGQPLGLTPPGRFLRQVAHLLGKQATAVDVLTLLKHPLCARGSALRGDHLLHTRDLELFIRKTGMPFPDHGSLVRWAKDDQARIWAHWIGGFIDQCKACDPSSLSGFVDGHKKLAESLVSGPEDSGTPDELWAEAAGREAITQITTLADAADGIQGLTHHDYTSLFDREFAKAEVRLPDPSHPNIRIRGPLEARIQSADLILLGGLNESVWPATPEPDPWLNRSMRQEVGLLLPERQVGLSAHDFQQAVSKGPIVLSRSIRSDDAPTVPSRWINRLTNLLDGLATNPNKPTLVDEMRSRGATWIDLAQIMDRPDAPVKPSPRPSPVPPPDALPRSLSVTSIRTLIRDPYAIYAREVLRLRALDPLIRPPDAAMRGTLLHDILEGFIRRLSKDEVPLTQDAFLREAELILNENLPWPSVRRLWRARLARVAEWFIEREVARQNLASPEALEVAGSLTLADLGFTLTAKADRIDVSENGLAYLYDYKTGKPPSVAQQKAFDNQLLLEALMVEEGAFEGLGPLGVERATYIGLGVKPTEVPAPLDELPPAKMKERLSLLVGAYLFERAGFTARRAAEREQWAGDYDHLARFGEWDLTVMPTKRSLK